MDLIEQYNLVISIGAPVAGLLVALVAWRVMRDSRQSRAGLIPESPDPEQLDEFGDDEQEDPPAPWSGPSPEVHDLEPPAPPVVGLAALRKADPQLSLPALSAELCALFSAAWTARGSGDLGRLAERFSEGARESLLAGRHGVVREVLVGPPELTEATVDDAWAHLDARFDALVTEVRNGAPAALLVRERWSLKRQNQPSAPWTVRQIEDREVEPLHAPPLERGHEVHHGSSLATVLAPDLDARREELLAAHPGLDLDALGTWLLDLQGRILEARDAGDPAALGELVTADQRGALELRAARLERTGLKERHADHVGDSAELCRVDRDGRYTLLTFRVRARARSWIERSTGEIASGDPETAVNYSEYWTLIRPRDGEPPFARGRQGFALWRIQDDEAYDG